MQQFTKKSITVSDVIKKMEYYCAYQERCHYDIEIKLKKYHLIPQAKEKVILHLREHNFLNEERFAKSFASGKFSIKKWGRLRIINALKFRQISNYLINEALSEISEQRYLDTFDEIPEKKWHSLQELDPLQKKKKMLSFLAYRGWEFQLINAKINQLTKNKY